MPNLGALARLAPILAILVFCAVLTTNLLPSAPPFSFHDNTQPSRIAEFAQNIIGLDVTPKFAPNYLYGIGYPLFKFYAPAAYYITTTFALLGLQIYQAINISFALAVFAAALSMYALVRYISGLDSAGLLSGSLYASSPWLAVDIFVRGNLAETWFMALLPASIYFLINKNRGILISVVLITAALTTHNALSLVLFLLLIAIVVGSKNKNAVIKLTLAALVSAFFWLPFIIDLHLTQARQIALNTKYFEHFLCPSQLYNIAWGFGGSTVGCTADGMSFSLGKAQVAASFGMLLLLISKPKMKHLSIVYVILALTVISVFMTLQISQPLWDAVRPLQSFQFPWRFNAFTLFGVCFFGGMIATSPFISHAHSTPNLKSNPTNFGFWTNSWRRLPAVVGLAGVRRGICPATKYPDSPKTKRAEEPINQLSTKYMDCFKLWPDLLNKTFVPLVLIGLLVLNAKYFAGQTTSTQAAQALHSPSFIKNQAVFNVPEYVSADMDYTDFTRLKNNAPTTFQISDIKQKMQPLLNETFADKIGKVVAILALATALFLQFKHVTHQKHSK